MNKIIQELRRDFIHSIPLTIDEIRSAIKLQDTCQVGETIHRLKGAAMLCRFETVEVVACNYAEKSRQGASDTELISLAEQLIEQLRLLTTNTSLELG